MKHQPRRNNPGKLHALLFSNSVGSLTSHIELINGEGIVVYSPYPRRLERLTICIADVIIKAALFTQLF